MDRRKAKRFAELQATIGRAIRSVELADDAAVGFELEGGTLTMLAYIEQGKHGARPVLRWDWLRQPSAALEE